jgi:hypothetical protein
MEILLEKIKELPDAKHPKNIDDGHIVKGSLLELPKVGNNFWVGHTWRTSTVEEIIDGHTFKTMNSIYRWKAINQPF